LANGIVGRLIARFAGRGAAVISGAVFRSTDWPSPVLPCSPLSCARAGEAITADAANKAALATAHNRILNRFNSAIYLSSAAICFIPAVAPDDGAYAGTGRPARARRLDLPDARSLGLFDVDRRRGEMIRQVRDYIYSATKRRIGHAGAV
jgi:hypothetical protein